jgi:GTP cyclohydrolase I
MNIFHQLNETNREQCPNGFLLPSQLCHTGRPMKDQSHLTQATFIPTSTDTATMAGELILRAVGEDLGREGLIKTPERFAKAIKEICAGYNITPEEAIGGGIFPGEGNGLISIKDIDFFSLCEHHMLPFWGKVSVSYYPSDKIVGLSKIPRLVEVFSRRLQVQERLTQEIATNLARLINARSVAVKISGAHMCMMMRGVKKTGSETITEFSTGTENLSEAEVGRLWNSLG